MYVDVGGPMVRFGEFTMGDRETARSGVGVCLVA